MKNKKIKFAVVGIGHIGKRHAEMIAREETAELVAVCDIRQSSDCGSDSLQVPHFTNIKDLLNSSIDIDVVNICTPNGLHSEQAIMSLEAGKHVVVEKPMGLTKEDCEKVIYTALKANRQVFCVMQNRYSPPSVWIKEIMDKKRLGEIYLVQLNCYWNRDGRYYKKGGWKGTHDLDGGTLFTQFSHFIDIMYWLFGDITDIQAKFADFNHANYTDFEDSGFVSFRFINGGMGCLNYSTSISDQNLESSMTIIGQNGSVKIGGQYMNEVEVCNIRDYTMPQLAPTNPGNDYGPYKGSAANHNYVIQNVIDTLTGKASATTNALEGLKTVEIIEKIYDKRNLESLNQKTSLK